jgi:hypothetical protein
MPDKKTDAPLEGELLAKRQRLHAFAEWERGWAEWWANFAAKERLLAEWKASPPTGGGAG